MRDFREIRKMVRTLNRYKNPPNKDLGEGLNTTFQKMKEFGLKNPYIAEEGNYLKVVLPHSPLAVPTAAIMDFLRSHEQITNRHARDITGIRSENLVKWNSTNSVTMVLSNGSLGWQDQSLLGN